MTKSNIWHHYLLTVTAIGVTLVAIYSIINPKVGNRQVADFTFPPTIPLLLWDSIGNHKIDLSSIETEDRTQEIKSSNRYQYTTESNTIDIDMYYLVNTRGNIEKLFKNQKQIELKELVDKEIKQQNKDRYLLFSDRDRSYLSTCLNSDGTSTVTAKQFSQNLNDRQLSWQLLKNWLLGKDSIRDRRCLWIVISIPQQNSSFVESTTTLEQVWKHWQQWWKPNFPSL